MAQIVIEQPGVPAKSVNLAIPEVTLGRAEDNTVVLVADEVSRHHAKLCKRGEKYVLTDLNSLNGTYVNRQQVLERVLSHNDEVWFGSKCRLLFLDDEETKAPGKAQPSPADSALVQHIEKIRADMDRVGNSMTLIAEKRRSAQTVALDSTQASQDELVAMGRAFRRISALYKASNQTSRLIASNSDLATRLSKVLDTAIEITEAERGFVMLRDEATDGLRIHMAREMGQELKASSPSMGIAGHAAKTGEPVLMGDRDRDQEFGVRDSIIAQKILSAMCVPLKVEDRILGSIYVDTRRAGYSFDEEDLEIFASIAAQSAMAIENVRLYEQMVEAEKKRANLGRFLSPAIVDAIMKEDKALELGGRKKVVTTMFCDIRGFTPIAERLAPSDLVEMLNEHFTAMVDVIFSFQGTLDKYIGDEIMAVFGAPLATEDDPHRAVKAALAMRGKNAELNSRRAQSDSPQFEMGIGIATGEVIAGYIGAPERMEFTVVGDRVNTARRLCSIAEPSQIVVCEPTYEHVQDTVEGRSIGAIVLKGKEVPVRAYEVIGFKS